VTRLIVDVREPSEFAGGHVEGAINIPPSVMMAGLPSELADVPKDTEIILYCLSGSRSNASMHFLRQYGFTNLVNGINKNKSKRGFFKA
jgi:rhodanese-related sulfurtransferase